MLKLETVIHVPSSSSSASSSTSGSKNDNSSSTAGDRGSNCDSGDNAPSDDDTAHMSPTELALEVTRLRLKVRAAETSWTASRAELCLAVRQGAVAEQRVSEQQASITSLTAQLARTTSELHASGSASSDQLRRQMSDTTVDLNKHKRLLAIAERTIHERSGELAEAHDEINLLQGSLAAARMSQDDLVTLCGQYSKDSESAAVDYVRSFSERVLLEREDVIARLSALKDLDRELRSLGTIEAQKELQRLREELFKCRRSETQKERENVFLQKQLILAFFNRIRHIIGQNILKRQGAHFARLNLNISAKISFA